LYINLDSSPIKYSIVPTPQCGDIKNIASTNVKLKQTERPLEKRKSVQYHELLPNHKGFSQYSTEQNKESWLVKVSSLCKLSDKH